MPKGEKRDYHKILDVSRNATEDEIKAAYKKMARIWHPDRHETGKEAAAQKFIEGHEAYIKLMDAKRPRRRDEEPRKSAKGKEPEKAASANSDPPKSKASADGDAGPPPQQSNSPAARAASDIQPDKPSSAPGLSPTPSNCGLHPDSPSLAGPSGLRASGPDDAPAKPKGEEVSPPTINTDARSARSSPKPVPRSLSPPASKKSPQDIPVGPSKGAASSHSSPELAPRPLSHPGEKNPQDVPIRPATDAQTTPSSPQPVLRPLSSHPGDQSPQDMPTRSAKGSRSNSSSPKPVPRPLSPRENSPQEMPTHPPMDTRSVPSSPEPIPRPLSPHVGDGNPQTTVCIPRDVHLSPNSVRRPLSSHASERSRQSVPVSLPRGVHSTPSTPNPAPRPLSSHVSERSSQGTPVSLPTDVQSTPSSPEPIPRALPSHASHKGPQDLPVRPEWGPMSTPSSPETVQESLLSNAGDQNPQEIPTSPETTPSDSPKSPAEKLRALLRKKRKPSPELGPDATDDYVYIPKSKNMPTEPNGAGAGANVVVKEGGLEPSLCPIFSLSSSKEWAFPLKLTLEELFHGAPLRFRVTRRLLSHETKESLVKITIPEGTLVGTKIRCPGVGHERQDGTFQDVVFIVEEKPHDRFHRVKDDLFVDMLVPYADQLADDGGDISVKGIDGTEIKVNVPYPVDQTSTEGELVVKGAGMPFRKGRGDLIVRWQVVFPSPTSKWDSVKKALLIHC